MDMPSTVHELAEVSKGRRGVNAAYRYLLTVGNDILFLGSDHIVGKGDVLGSHDKDEVSINLLSYLNGLLGQLIRWHFPDLILYIILYEHSDRKVKIKVSLLCQGLIFPCCFQNVHLRVKILAHEDCHGELLFIFGAPVDGAYDGTESLHVSRRCLNHYICLLY